MFTVGKPASSRILAVRLGAMGDIIHTLPAVAFLKSVHPGAALTWAVEPKWAPLLEDNPSIDRLVLMRRDTPAGMAGSWRALCRGGRYDLAVDFQGLIKSALVASAARPDRIFGFHHTQVRERAAALFYSDKIVSRSRHVVDRNLDLAAAAAGAPPGASAAGLTFPLPAGHPEGCLPPGDFVLASPLAGWRGKQWPVEHYRVLAARLARELDVPLVLDCPPGSAFPAMEGAVAHSSGVAGLIHATRRAAAVLGVDSGPLHLAAALGRPGVAVFGPTDPARNGPHGGSIRVLRSSAAATTYKRRGEIDPSMRQISPGEVFDVLREVLGKRASPAQCVV